jgi:hypothetical protein
MHLRIRGENMILIAIAASILASTPSFISPLQAICASEWFCDKVEVGGPYKVEHVYFMNPLYNVNDVKTIVYDVLLQAKGGKKSISVLVDAQSGEVYSAKDEAIKTELYEVSEVTKKWLKNLDIRMPYRPDPEKARYDVFQKGYRYFNDNEPCQIYIGSKDGQFAFYQGVMALPDVPATKPRINAVEAIRLASEEQKRTKAVAVVLDRAELGLLYSHGTKRNDWVWRVSRELSKSDAITTAVIIYVDGDTGAIVPDILIQSNIIPYRSPNYTSRHIKGKPEGIDLKRFDLARKKLRELVGDDINPQTISLHPTFTISDVKGSVSVDEAGKLLSFEKNCEFKNCSVKPVIEKGQALIKAQYGPLPEGHFEQYDGSPTSCIEYTENIFGSPVVNKRLVVARFDYEGQLAEYRITKQAIRPKSLPLQIIAKDKIAQIAKIECSRDLLKGTADTHYYVDINPHGMGWFVVDENKEPVYVYRVQVMFMHSNKWGSGGGGTDYYYDAVSGQRITPKDK